MLYKIYKDWTNRDRLNEYLDSLDKDVLVYVDNAKRSLALNRLFHANVRVLANHNNIHVDEVKCGIKDSMTQAWIMKLCWTCTRKNWTEYVAYRSTADMDNQELCRVLDYVYQVGEFLKLQMIDPSFAWLDRNYEPLPTADDAKKIFNS